jgi:hypothetical protein
MTAIGDTPPLCRRRDLLVAGTVAIGILALPGAAIAQDAAAPVDPVHRLLELSVQNTLNRLAQPEGFWNSRLARFGVPVLFKKGANPASPLNSTQFREQLQHKLNNFAEAGARGAVPAVTQAARNLSIPDPTAVLRGAPTYASSMLRLAMGSDLVNALLQPIEAALVAAQDPLIAQALAQLPGVTLRDVAHAIALAADNGIWYEIGATEADIRANPEATNDPALIAAIRAARVPATPAPQPQPGTPQSPATQPPAPQP